MRPPEVCVGLAGSWLGVGGGGWLACLARSYWREVRLPPGGCGLHCNLVPPPPLHSYEPLRLCPFSSAFTPTLNSQAAARTRPRIHPRTTQAAAVALAQLDALHSLAAVARSPGYSRPIIMPASAPQTLSIKGGRHPMLVRDTGVVVGACCGCGTGGQGPVHLDGLGPRAADLLCACV